MAPLATGMDPELARCLALWRLEADGAHVQTVDGAVLFVRRGAERLVLKRVGNDERAQPRVLDHWSGQGAVRLLEQADEVMLMERAWPGRPLSELVFEGRDNEATEVVCSVISALHNDPPPDGFRTVEDWGEGFDRVRRQALAGGAAGDIIDLGQRVYADLCASQGERFLLHGDLHHDNILEDEARGWLAIDPKGVVGELAYETGAMLRNPGKDPDVYADPAVIARRTAILAGRLGLDAARIIGWCFAQAVLSALWCVEDGLNAAPAWRMAGATRPLLQDAAIEPVQKGV